MPNLVLPDSKIEIINLSSNENICKLAIDMSRLTEQDLNVFVFYYLDELAKEGVPDLDFSGCTFQNADSSHVERWIFLLRRLLKKWGSVPASVIAKAFVQGLKLEKEHLYLSLMEEIFSFTDEEFCLDLFKIFGNVLQKKEEAKLASFLENGKKRYYPMALLLSTLYGLSEVEILEAFCKQKIYREGLYNRAVVDTLLALVNLDNKDLSDHDKKCLIEYCQKRLEKCEDKREHYHIWSLLKTLLLSKMSEKLKKLCVEIQAAPSQKILENFYKSIFKELMTLSESEYEIYLKCFDSPLHHIILAMRQSILNDGSQDKDLIGKQYQTLLDEFIKGLLVGGIIEYRKSRYNEADNPHLNIIFKQKEGALWKSIWSRTVEPMIQPEGAFKGYTVCNTDHYWDLLTWGMGINCLEPHDATWKLVSHLLDGQHRLLLMRDQNSEVIAGCFFHLLLSDLKDPKPIIAIGRVYLRGGIERRKGQEIQKIFDKAATSIAKDMQLPLIAILTNEWHQFMIRDIPNVEEGPAVFCKSGYTNTKAWACSEGKWKGPNGLDYDWFVYKDRNQIEGIGRVIYDYQYLYVPPLPLLNNTATTLPAFEANKIRYTMSYQAEQETSLTTPTPQAFLKHDG